MMFQVGVFAHVRACTRRMRLSYFAVESGAKQKERCDMTLRTGFGYVVVLAFSSGMLATSAQAQGYGDYGAGSLDSYYNFSVPPPLRSIAPSFSYNGNPYNPFPRSFSYEVPPNAYAPNSYTYDLRAYGYGYPPPAYGPPAYSPPAYSYSYPYSYPYGYSYGYPYSYPYGYSYPVPRYQRGAYRQLSLRQYIDRQAHGPVRVRDIVRNMPELGGQASTPGQ
jgi:hypothetical protein